MIEFKRLWQSHATISGDDNPCMKDGKPAFTNQCAIRVGNALAKCGHGADKLPRVTHCWHHKLSEGHVLRADELARALQTMPPPGFRSAELVTSKNFHKKIDGRKGIIYFEDYWARAEDRGDNRTGDHIDLWNGDRLTDWSSRIRIQFGVTISGIWSDFELSKKILFWQVGK